MTDTPSWEMRPRCLVIVPGLSFDEFATEVWAPVRATHESVNFYLGDALLYADQYGDKASQLFDEWLTPARMMQLKWVSEAIPAARRRDECSWTIHRLVAGLFNRRRGIFPAAYLDRKTEHQDQLLDRAAREGWHTDGMKAEIDRIEQEALGNLGHNLPPGEAKGTHLVRTLSTEPESITRVIEPEGASDPGEKINTATAGAAGAAELDEAEPAPDVAADAVPASPGPPDAPGDRIIIGLQSALDPGEPRPDDREAIIELRRCIEAVRAIAPALAAETSSSIVTDARILGRDIFAALGRESSAWCPLLSVEAAQRLIGAEWSIRKSRDPGATTGEVVWAVELRWGHGIEARIAIGIGPHEPSAIVEAALAAAISGAGKCE